MRKFVVKDKKQNTRLQTLSRSFYVFLLICFAIVSAFFVYRVIEKKYIYPLGFKEIVIEYADKYELDRALVFAVIQVESSFDKNSVSKAGAEGLMQITPTTASYIAKKLGKEKYDIFNERTNIEFGCYYLRYLFNRFYYTDTVICAYNAGEGNIKYWLKNQEYSLDGKTFIKVPYKETEEYRNKIQRSYKKYKQLYENILDKI